MTTGAWTTKASAREAAEERREQIRLEKRLYKDLRWAAERSVLEDSDWVDLLALHRQYGAEGNLRLERELIPFWNVCQRKQRALARATGHPQTVTAAEILAKFSTESTGAEIKTN
jgi:hypothetical protein